MVAQIEFIRIEPAMLAGENERGAEPTRGERLRDGRQLDRFRSGSNDQPYVRSQPSP
jgi:hypothetical protein